MVALVRKTALDFKEFFMREETRREMIQKSWQLPPQDLQKINIDGSFDAESKKGGWGLIIRDAEGDIAFSGAGRIEKAQYPFMLRLKPVSKLCKWPNKMV